MLKVKWGRRAFRIFVRQWRWEGDNVGIQAAETLRINVSETIQRIQQMPTIGRKHKTIGNKTYRIISTHPKSALYYWHDKKELHIVRFVIAQVNKTSFP